jgi:asparagine synthase (glutamine-hydrolysing)
MCGIVGGLNTTLSRTEWKHLLTRMSERLVHRGPDDGGVWVDEKAGIGFGHRRLSILDLSVAGHQPMHSQCGRYVVTYNGEIYNFQELHDELEVLGHKFRGHSDTEVLLAAVSEWGVEKAVGRFNGMFAFGLWDREQQTLYLCRDRIGEKPLYFGWVGASFLFASELKALMTHPDFIRSIDRNSLALYLRHNYIPAPFTIYQGVSKLTPGTILAVREKDLHGRVAIPVSYWSARDVAEEGQADSFAGSAEDAATELEALLLHAVKLRMVADVPLGAFLSGGIDSSTVVALMQAQSDRPVKTFTIGFHEALYDEADHARSVARHLGTEHTELYVTPAEAQAVIPRLPSLYDEPFSDSSQIPTFLVSQLARQSVTVAMSGDGGDELFGGYNRYCWAQDIWRVMGWLPAGVRVSTARMLTFLAPRTWDRILLGRWTSVMGQHLSGDKLYKLAQVLTTEHPAAVYLNLVSHWRDPQAVVLEGNEPLTTLTDHSRWAKVKDLREQMMFLDTMTYLPDDILVKVDRATMGVSLEGRIPLLDHRVVEFVWRLPVSMKIRGRHGKLLLRHVLKKYVQMQLLERPKMGFGVPIDSWLRGPLREWAEELLDARRLEKEGFFSPQPIREKWVEHLSGKRNWQYHLWDVLMFQAWLNEYRHA